MPLTGANNPHAAKQVLFRDNVANDNPLNQTCLMRFLYSLAWWLSLPLLVARLWLRGRKEPGYRLHMAERFGFYWVAPSSAPRIWVHAVSVGETRAAEPLILALLKAYPQHDILLTHMTPTGRATGKALFCNQPRITQAYLPYDTTWMMGRLTAHFKPLVCILMETEVWPNLVARCQSENIPVVLANARLSRRSLEKGLRLSSLMSEAARGFSLVAAQTATDAERLKQFGARHVYVTGSVKFDAAPPDNAIENGRTMRTRFGQRPVLVCASTREGEEELILGALGKLDPEVLVILIPRHPQRFDEVAALIEKRGILMRRRSSLPDSNETLPSNTRILLGDSMGEMFTYYAASDMAFIGGSLLPLGGQNLIEACALGKPVLIGPHTFNFEAITEDAVAMEAARRITDVDDMIRQANILLRDSALRTRLGERALSFAHQQRGATERTMELLRPLLSE